MSDLGTLGGDGSQAFGLNDRGQIVGAATTADGVSHAFRWDPRSGRMADLGVLPGHVVSFARDVNELGQVVGTSAESPTAPRGLPVESAHPDDERDRRAGRRPERGAGGQRPWLRRLGRGAVHGANHAFVWSPVTRVATDLPGLAGGDSEAHDVNTTLRIAGPARAANGQFTAVLWDPVAEPPVGFRARTGASSAGP